MNSITQDMKFRYSLMRYAEKLMIFDKHANLKYGNRHFWTEEYYVSTAGLNEAIKQYERPLRDCKGDKGNRLEHSESQRL